MRLNRLSIKRFGIFRDEKLEDIGTGIVLIGGHNRAGKSTFLQIIKNLRGGFQRVPFPDRGEFEVDADLGISSDEVVNLSIKGLAEPKIVVLKGQQKNISLEDIYNNIDQFTYSRLFVISLEELQRIPAGLENRETERLQSILLGAGLAEMLYLPQLEEKFANEANRLGGKRGKANVRAFKPYNDSIREALKLRDQALSETDEYYKKRRERDILYKQVADLEEQVIPQKKIEFTKIETLNHIYDLCEEKLRLENRIEKIPLDEFPEKITAEQITLQKMADFSEKLKEIDEAYNDNRNKLQQKVNKDLNIEKVKQKLLLNKDKINGFYHMLSGLKEKTTAFITKEEKCSEDARVIESKMNSINQNWEGKFENIRMINTDQIEWDRLNRTLEAFKRTSSMAEEIDQNLKEVKEEKRHLEEFELPMIVSSDIHKSFRNYFLLSIIIILSSVVGAVFIEPLLGLIGLVGIGGVLIFSINKMNTLNRNEEKKSDLEAKLHRIDKTIEKWENDKTENQEIWNKQEKDVKNYILQLKLQKDVSIDMIKEYFREIQSLKNRIADIDKTEKDLNDEKEDLLTAYAEIQKVIIDIYEIPVIELGEFNEILAQKEMWFQQIETLQEILISAEEMELSAKGRSELRKKIEDYCGIGIEEEDIADKLKHLQEGIKEYHGWQTLKEQLGNCNDSIRFEIKKEPVREAFGLIGSDQHEELERLVSYFMTFSSQADVNLTKDRVREELTDLQNELAAKRKGLQVLEIELKNLSTTDKIEKAQKDIREKRHALLPLAEKYATYRAAEFILSNARERIIAQTKNKSLKSAGEIFRTITDGEYSSIMPADELIKADFKATLADQAIQDTVDILSRGTREQLFFSVRVSRIKEIEPLPVIIDDSLVNFDANHLQKAITILKDLSITHQIFVLTSHAKIVSLVAEQIESAQYWKLKKGKFFRTAKDELITYLG